MSHTIKIIYSIIIIRLSTYTFSHDEFVTKDSLQLSVDRKHEYTGDDKFILKFDLDPWYDFLENYVNSKKIYV